MTTRIILLFLSWSCSFVLFAQDDIVAMEYYIDTDPGVGNGIAISITSGVAQEVSLNISTASISEGFHELVVRAQDSNNDWSTQESRVFYVSSSATTSNDITALEYFFDTDPGIGSGSAIAITDANSIDIDELIDLNSLSSGFHTINVRAQDSNGVWGIAKSSSFLVDEISDASRDSQITSLEYFFDVDPGIGNGTSIDVTDANVIDISELINTSSLSSGFHTINVRAQDSNGVWGIAKSSSFLVDEISDASGDLQITSLEYFFDTDPGIGNGTSIDVTDANAIDVDELIDISALSSGFHTINVRGQDANGAWGMIKYAVFFVDELTPSSGASALTSIEYFLGSDPGIGAATEIAISPSQSSIDQDFTVATSSLPNGTYSIGVRVSDENSVYSLTNSAEFTICDSPTADFAVTTVCIGSVTDFTDLSSAEAGDIYSWDFDGDGNEDSSTAGDASFTYANAGTYTAILTINRSGCSDQSTVTVTVEEIPVANAGNDQTVSVDQATLNATAPDVGETGTWTIVSGTATITNVNDPQTGLTSISEAEVVLRWTVVNDAAGCSDEDEVTITYNEPLSMETDILTFVLSELTDVAGINTTAHTVSGEVVRGTDLTALIPTITVSDGATITPMSGTTQSFFELGSIHGHRRRWCCFPGLDRHDSRGAQ